MTPEEGAEVERSMASSISPLSEAVKEFICSNDMAFRTYSRSLRPSDSDIKEGTEVLWVPFRKEELESVLEGLVA